MPGLMNRDVERAVLDRFVAGVRAGEGQSLVVLGEPGVGKTVLLDYLTRQASGCRTVRAVGVQSEMELAFAGLHQLCGPLLGHTRRLPGPQQRALQTVFGLSEGPPPDPFMVGLAVLSLLSEVAGERPLICVIDDEQWLDRASAQTLTFAARRLAAEPVGVVFAARELGAELGGLPELVVEGLRERDARALLDSALAGPLDARVRELIVAETRGNPLALLELPRGLTQAELAGGFGLPGAAPLTGPIEESFRRQLEALPADTRRLLVLAAADPSGDPALMWRAAGQLGIPVQAARPARKRVWRISVSRCGSGIRWCGRWRTSRRRLRSGRRHTGRWRRRPTRRLTRTGGPGTGRRRRTGRMRRWRQSWTVSGPGAGPRRAGRGRGVPGALGAADRRSGAPWRADGGGGGGQSAGRRVRPGAGAAGHGRGRAAG